MCISSKGLLLRECYGLIRNFPKIIEPLLCSITITVANNYLDLSSKEIKNKNQTRQTKIIYPKIFEQIRSIMLLS